MEGQDRDPYQLQFPQYGRPECPGGHWVLDPGDQGPRQVARAVRGVVQEVQGGLQLALGQEVGGCRAPGRTSSHFPDV